MKQEGMENTHGGVNVSNPLFPLEYFPARVNRVVVTARVMGQGGQASGAFDPKTNTAYIPIGQAARDRAVRRHEASHANLPCVTEVKMTALFQGVEDMRIHTLAMPFNNDSSRRDELVFALGDMRRAVSMILPQIKKMAEVEPELVRVNMVPVVRALAILHYGVTNRRGCESKTPEARVAKTISKVVAAFEAALGKAGILAAIAKAVKALEHDNVVKAQSIMRPFLTLSNNDAKLDQPKQQGGGQGKPQPKQDSKKSDKDQSPSGRISAKEDEEKKPEEKKSDKKQDSKKSDDKKDEKEAKSKSDKKDEKEKTDKSDSKAEEEDENDSSESGDSKSDESDEDESEESGDSESGEGDSDEDEEAEEESGDSDAGKGDSEDESNEDESGEGEAEGDSDGDQAADVPCNDEQAQPEGTKGGIGDSGDQIQDAMEDGRITAESLALLDPETIKELLEYHGSGAMPTMKIRKLDYRMSKKITEGIDYRLANSGSRINVSRIPRIFDPKPGKIFERIGEQKGGTVLIDASGSMNLDHERLSRLAESLPIGQIAYYNGGHNRDDRGNEYSGALVIYSKDGRSFKLTAGERLPDIYGGNTVDFQAIQWLLKQPAPRWLVSDNYFCGSCTTSAATELAQRAYARKMITFFATLGEVEISLHMRTELDDHDKVMFERSGGDNLLKKLSPCPVCHGQGKLHNPHASYWPDGAYTHDCAGCNGRGVRKLC